MFWFILGGAAIVGLFWFLMPEAVSSMWATVKGWFRKDESAE